MISTRDTIYGRYKIDFIIKKINHKFNFNKLIINIYRRKNDYQHEQLNGK